MNIKNKKMELKTIDNCYPVKYKYLMFGHSGKIFKNYFARNIKIVMAESVGFRPKCWMFINMNDFQDNMTAEEQVEVGFSGVEPSTIMARLCGRRKGVSGCIATWPHIVWAVSYPQVAGGQTLCQYSYLAASNMLLLEIYLTT